MTILISAIFISAIFIPYTSGFLQCRTHLARTVDNGTQVVPIVRLNPIMSLYKSSPLFTPLSLETFHVQLDFSFPVYIRLILMLSRVRQRWALTDLYTVRSPHLAPKEQHGSFLTNTHKLVHFVNPKLIFAVNWVHRSIYLRQIRNLIARRADHVCAPYLPPGVSATSNKKPVLPQVLPHKSILTPRFSSDLIFHRVFPVLLCYPCPTKMTFLWSTFPTRSIA